MTRGDVQRWLLRRAAEISDLVVGLDFAFSLPAWFISDELHAADVFGAWDIVAREAEAWLEGAAPWPFWGRGARAGSTNLPSDRAFRQTERDVAGITSTNPKSVFQLVGSGQVGPGSLRGIAMLRELRASGFVVWPFDGVGLPLVIEIYPRVLTGDVVKSDPDARTEFLARFGDFDRNISTRAAATEHAFDAACSAVVMSRHSAEFDQLRAEAHQYGIEGKIWVPASAPVHDDARGDDVNYWLVSSGTTEEPHYEDDWRPRRDRWFKRYGEVWQFAQRPRIAAGDRLVTYAVGSAQAFGKGRVFSLYEVTSEPAPGEHDRWRWKVDLRYLASVPLLSQSPTLDDIGVSSTSVRRQTHIRLTSEQGCRAEKLIRDRDGSDEAIANRKAARAATIEQRLSRLPDDVAALRALAATPEDHEGAIAINMAILALAPGDVPALNRLARAYEATGSPDEAITTFYRVLSIDSTNAVARGRLRNLLRKRHSD